MGCEVWGVGCGVWGVGCGVWGVGCEVRRETWDVALDAGAIQPAARLEKLTPVVTLRQGRLAFSSQA